MKWGVATLFVLAFAACSPEVVWHGRSPDHGVEARIMHLRADQWVRVAGVDGPVFEGIGALAFSADGARVAYAALKAKTWRVVVESVVDRRVKAEVGPAVDGVGDLAWSADGARLVYEAERAGRWQMVERAASGAVRWGTPHEALYEGTLRFDGRRIAYVASDGACVRVVVAGEIEVLGACFEGIGALVMEGRVVYVARAGAEAFVVVDSAVGRAHERVSMLAVGGGSVAYVAHRGGRAFVVRDEGERDEGDAITGLTLSRDGRSAWVTQVGDRQYVVVDGVRGPARDIVDAPVFGPDGVLGYVEKDGAETRVVVDGQVIGTHEDAGELVLAAGRVAYVAVDVGVVGDGGRARVVVDGEAFVVAALLPGTLMFSRAGERWGCLSGDPVSRDVMLVVDGKVRRALDFAALAAHLQTNYKRQRAVDVDTYLRRWVQAELERP